MNVALRSEPFNIISLCTGGGGLDLGIELAMPNARSVVFMEREAFSCSHLVAAMQQGLMAPAALWSDVTTFDGRPWRGIVDGLIGGIPCQPHSLAGKRQGSDDERDLWSDARRIIVQSRPWVVLIENVEGMLSAKPGLDPGALRVRRDLQRLGFSVEGGLFTASEVGASHQRLRVFILGVADTDGRQPERRPPNRHRNGQAAATRSICRSSAGLSDELAHADSKRLEGIGALDRARGWQNARGSAGLCDRAILEHASGELRREPSAGQFTQLQSYDGFGGRYVFPPGPSDLRGWAGVLASAPELEPAFRRVADGLASRLDIARVDRLRMLGNGVVSLEGAYAFRTLAARLAAGGSRRATWLVRMMEAEN